MRIKQGFVLREIAGQVMVIATGEASKDFHGMIKLNQTGKEIWQSLQEGHSEVQIIQHLQDKYDVEPQQAEQDVTNFISKMREMGFIVNE